MKTMKQTWVRSLAAFALLASTQEVTRAALAANAKGEGQPVDVARLLEDGKLLYETGKLDEAELRLNEAAKRAPQNEKASYYLSLIQERRYAQNTKDPNAIQTPSRAAENPTAPDLATKRQQDYYYRLMMERYHIMPPSTSLVVPRMPELDAIVPRLQTIVLDEVMFDGVPLPEVLRFLDEESRKRDPDKKGINFLINPNTTQSTPGTVIDPQTGQPVAGPPPEAMEMNSVVIRFNLPLRNVRLKDVLNAIVRVADKPIEYSIEEYGVLFSQAANPSADSTVAHASKSLGTDSLQVRTFKMDTDKLLPGMNRAFGINLEELAPDRSDDGSTSPGPAVEDLRKELAAQEKQLTNLLTQFTDQNQFVVDARAKIAALKEELKRKSPGEPRSNQVQGGFQKLLTQLGVKMDVPGKALYYNDLTGILMVRATTEDLAIVQGAVETLGGVANQQRAGSSGEGARSSAEDLMRRRYGLGSAKR